MSERGTSELANAIFKALINYKNNVPANLQTGQNDRVVELKKENTSTFKTQDKKIEKVTKDSKPVFKIQILASDKVIAKNSRQFKGLSPVDYYKENGMIKYTYAEDTDYNKILRIKRKTVYPNLRMHLSLHLRMGKR